MTAPYFSVVTRDGIYKMLLELKKQLLPEHTEDNPEDPLNALLSVFSYEGQRQSAMLDMAALEMDWLNCRRRASLIAMGYLTGFSLDGNKPAKIKILADVTTESPSGSILVEKNAAFGAPNGVQFEALAQVAMPAQLLNIPYGATPSLTLKSLSSVFSANDGLPASMPISVANDALYYCHEALVPEGFNVTIAALTSAAKYSVEYYEGHSKQGHPSSVTNNGDGTLTFKADSFFGWSQDTSWNYSTALSIYVGGPRYNANDAVGLVVRIKSLETGTYEDVSVVSSTGPSFSTATVLGQTSVSTDVTKYIVSCEWRPFKWYWDKEVTGSAADITAKMRWVMPFEEQQLVTATDTYLNLNETQQGGREWKSTSVNGVTGYWMRIRMTATTGAAPMNFSDLSFDADDTAYTTLAGGTLAYTVPVDCIQGKTITESFGISTGTANQIFSLGNVPVNDSPLSMEVGSVVYSKVETLFGSGPNGTNFLLIENPDGTFSVKFGDGVDGKIPPTSDEIIMTYRIGAESSGNVGALTVSTNKSGQPFLGNIRNPSPGRFWEIKQADTSLGTEGMEVARRAGSAFVRSVSGVNTPTTLDLHLTKMELADGSSPIDRAIVYENQGGYNQATVRVVGNGGALLTAPELSEVGTAVNGTTQNFARYGGIGPINSLFTFINYTPVVVTITATVTVPNGKSGGVAGNVKAALSSYLNPTSLNEDGTFAHNPGGTIYDSKIKMTVAAAVDNLVDLTLTMSTPASSPAAGSNLVLATGELPDPNSAANAVISVAELA